MKKENLPPTVSSETQPPLPAREDIQSQWHNVVRRRSFLKGLGMVGATLLPANALLMTQGKMIPGSTYPFQIVSRRRALVVRCDFPAIDGCPRFGIPHIWLVANVLTAE